MTTEAPPKPCLADVLQDPGRIARLLELAGLERNDTQLIRAALFAAGLFAPAGRTVAELVAMLVHFGFQAVPASIGTPRPGDIYVRTDENRQPSRAGFVLKPALAKAGERAPWVKTLDAEGEGRVDTAVVDFWLRIPGG